MHELYTSRQVNKETIEAQKYKFQTKLEKLREKFYHLEFHSKMLENEMNILRKRK